MTRIGIALLLVAASAVAGPKFTLTFLDGKKKSVTLKAFDKDGLDASYGKQDVRIPWKELEPGSAFSARSELTPYNDGAARRDLAEFAVRLRLFPNALEELEVAYALGGLEEAGFNKRYAEIRALEVDFLCKRIDVLLKNKRDPDVCLAAIKQLKTRYPEHANNATYAPHIDRLVEELAKRVEKQKKAEAASEESAELAGLRKALQKVLKRKTAALEKAEQLFAESRPAIAKRQVSRVKKKLVDPYGAEKYYKRARKYMREMGQIDKQFKIVKKADLVKEYEAIEKRLIECYLGVARILLKERNYKGAVDYVRDILFYDPIHEEALEMVKTIKRNRIHFKASDITNARPRVTGG